MSWYVAALKRYADFEGRARRKEYWMFTLVNVLIYIALAIVYFFSNHGFWTAVYIIYYLAMIIPGLAVTVRRLHDTNHSGWWIFINLVPLVGGIILLIFTLSDSQPGENQYGTNPKETGNSAAMGDHAF